MTTAAVHRERRIAWAIEAAGLSVGQASRRLKRNATAVIVADDEDLQLLVRLAELCRVDPRWLATGIVSPAGAAALAGLERLWDDGQLDPLDKHVIRSVVTATPEPDKGAGVCRYCLCTDMSGCAHGHGGSCWWVDAAATICSACLEDEEL